MTDRARPRRTEAVVSRADLRLTADPRRVITKLFVPGDEPPEHTSRAAAVVRRVMDLDEAAVDTALSETLTAFSARHRNLEEVFERHYASIAHQVDLSATPSVTRRRLIGAYFTHEYAVEGAALFNPSIVPHPDQSRLEPGTTRFVLSVRGVGEGHLSCIGFRTGVVGPDGAVRVDEPAMLLSTGLHRAAPHDLGLIRDRLTAANEGTELAAYLTRNLRDGFTAADLDAALAELDPQLAARPTSRRAIEHIHQIAAGDYEVEFDPDTALDERILWPASPTESHGMEDARFVRFTDDDGDVTYYATYTAYDGDRVAPQLLRTADFRVFQASQLTGPAAANKGMALFPRRVGGRYLAMSRSDGESNAITASTDLRHWRGPSVVQIPRQSWELTQIGNCGSPIETSHGWLLFTHGVGPMRAYAIGAVLLDLADPSRVVGRLTEPLLRPGPDERDGYVPNVVYSCGAMLHHGTVLLPYGRGDSSIAIARIDLANLIDSMA